MDISVVIPVYNSSGIIDSLCSRIATALSGFTYEIIFVNDGSKDDSWKKILDQTVSSKNITGINLKKNSGQDNALLAGLRQSLGAYVVIMDDDLQHDPNDIITLYEECKKGYDVCYANFKSKKQNALKNTGSAINGAVANVLVNKPKNIYLSPFKIISRSTVSEIIKFAGPYPYIDGILLTITQNITQVDIDHHKRIEGKGNYSLSRSVSVFMKMFTGFSVLPLRLATICGVFATLIGAILSLKYLYDYFIKKDFVEGWTTVVILIIFFGGLILLTLGIIGEYIGRMYLTLNNKPQYTISEIVKSKD